MYSFRSVKICDNKHLYKFKKSRTIKALILKFLIIVYSNIGYPKTTIMSILIMETTYNSANNLAVQLTASLVDISICIYIFIILLYILLLKGFCTKSIGIC